MITASVSTLLFTVLINPQLIAADSRVAPSVAMQKAKNATDFMMNHLHKKPGGVNTVEEDMLFSQAGSVSPSGASMIADMLAEGDACDPRPTSIVIPLNTSDVRAFYFPTCTKVNRCGGCCDNDLLECAPTGILQTTVKVMKCRYPEDGNSDMFDFEGLVDIPVEVHTACECRCRVQEYHCVSVKHVYNADSCQCQCRDRQMATHCPSNKHWDEQECACICPRITHCLNDEFFNFSTCSCQRASSISSGNAQPTVNPCISSTVKCRPGWTLAMQSDGRCACRVASSKLRRHLSKTNWRRYDDFLRHYVH